MDWDDSYDEEWDDATEFVKGSGLLLTHLVGKGDAGKKQVAV